MRALRKGQPHGPVLQPHQFANDWITGVPVDGGKPVLLRPAQTVLETVDDFEFFTNQMDSTACGTFWRDWELDRVTGRFSAVAASRSVP